MAEPATRIPSPGPGTRTARQRLYLALAALVTVLGGSLVGGALGLGLLIAGPPR